MGLLVLVLRSYLVFQNVYVTFKTLKMPPPSSRNGGKPTIRAMAQRKRDMKGCMTIWIVWCCLATYEAVVEPVISIFVPFYSEIKSVVLIAFILARARGAEPIYLHLIRPILKPYISTLDAILDIFHSVGDFVLLLVSIPFAPLLGWWRRRYPAVEEEDSDEDASDHGDPPPPYPTASLHPANLAREGPAVTDPARSAQLDAAMSKFYASASGAAQPDPRFWQPPPAAYEVEETPSMPMPQPHIPSFASNGPTHPYYSPPAQPPYPVMHSTPNLNVAPVAAKLLNPGPAGGSSDNNGANGVRRRTQLRGASDEEDDHMNIDDPDDSMYETEEDSFNKTLRTPYSLRIRPPAPQTTTAVLTPPPPLPTALARDVSIATEATLASSGSTSDGSNIFSDMTGLSTVRHAPTLRTLSRTTSLAPSDSPSVVGRKRPHPLEPIPDMPAASAPSPISRGNRPKTPRRAVTRTRPVGTRVAMNRLPSLGESLGNAADGEDSDAPAPAAPKRRKLARSPRKAAAPALPKPAGSRSVAGSRLNNANKTRGTVGNVRGGASSRTTRSQASTKLAESRTASSSSSKATRSAAPLPAAAHPLVPRRVPARTVNVKSKTLANA
ncbi:unnamed protein product [Peniophora sp. CBMAI 1063]|nr:unnamed protein product [Peniophora sp. CBMAI 1063]